MNEAQVEIGASFGVGAQVAEIMNVNDVFNGGTTSIKHEEG